jgi:hypothetical protein
MASIDADAILCYVVGRMEIKLSEAKKTRENGDFSEQEQIILKLKEVRKHLYTVEQNNLILIREAKNVLKDNSELDLRRRILLIKLAENEKEIKEIKENIKFQ